ncbi:DUF6261 family protein, partial [Parabacteroides sp. OttesenSCG-928-G07]|nr:DUF6261 family protein [Parabacteroides sp. OttesenSCG-928-G07]
MKTIIKPAVLRRLRNDEHFQTHARFILYLEEPIADFTELTSFFTAYKQLFNHEDIVFKHRSRMIGTQAVDAADRRRDDEFRSLRMAVKSGLRSIDPEIQAAAEILIIIIDNYKDAPYRNYSGASAYITNLIQELKSTEYLPLVTKLGLVPAVNLLDEANDAFEEVYSRRTSWLEQQRMQGNMQMIRPPVDEAFNELTFLINSLYASNEIGAKDADKRTKLAAIIDELNAELHNIARAIAYRQPGGSTNPDPDPHPEPEPGPIVPYHFRASHVLLINGRILAVSPTNFEEFADLIDVRMVGGIMDFHPDGRSNRFTLNEISYD